MTLRDPETPPATEDPKQKIVSDDVSAGPQLMLIRSDQAHGAPSEPEAPDENVPAQAASPAPDENDGPLILSLYGREQSNWPLGLAIVAAFIFHGALGTATHRIAVPKKMEERVKMEMYKPPPPPPPPPKEEPKQEEKKEEPKKKKKKKKKPKPKPKEAPPPPPPSNQEPPPEPAKKPPRVVTGISMKSTTKGKSGFKVRVGNTAYGDPDKEEFVRAEDVRAYSGGSRDFKPVRTAQLSRSASVRAKPKKPRYPRQVLEEGIEGRVLLEVEVTRQGTTRKVKVLKRLHPLLDKLSVRYVKKMKWRPAIQEGKKVDSKVKYSVKWELDDI